MHLRSWIGSLAGLAAAIGASSAPAMAQCAVCYTSAAATGDRGAAVLRLGILVLLIPTLLTFGGVLWLTLRGRRSEERENQPGEEREESVDFMPLAVTQQNRSPFPL